MYVSEQNFVDKSGISTVGMKRTGLSTGKGSVDCTDVIQDWIKKGNK